MGFQMAAQSNLRVLSRPPPPPPPPPQVETNSPPSILPPSDSNGIVVVGFVGSKPTDDATNVIDKIIDADVFGSGNDLPLVIDGDQHRKIKITYFYDSNKGMLFLHLSSTPSMSRLLQSLEELEFEHLADCSSCSH